MIRFNISLALFLIFMGLACSSLLGQAGVATIGGRVTDPSGAIIVGARVSAQNTDTKLVRNTVTDGSGYYSVVGLPIGRYLISAEQPGFGEQTATTTLDPSAKARMDFHLAVSTTNSQVDVTSNVPELSRDDSSVGTVIDNETITNTPLFQRNWDDLLRLVPGVQMQRFTQQSGSSTSGSTGLFTIHGIGNQQNNYILDGIDNNTFSENLQELSASASRPSVDVISEFKLISNAYTAVYGRSPGANIDVTTKGGANQIHGLLFEYVRNRVFDSNDYFTKGAGLPKPKQNQNQFGGNLSGPILRSQLFGFFNYEGTRIRQGITRLSTVPLANERIGDFSPAAAAANGTTYPTIVNPSTGVAFVNNKIPTSLIDPYGQKILNAFPTANLSGTLNNYARTGSLVDDTNSYNGRLDWSPGSKNLFFARYTVSDRIRNVPGYYGGIADGSSTSSWGNATLKGWSAVLGWTGVFSPQLTNDFRLGWVRNYAYDQQQPFGLNKNSDYIPGVPDNPSTQGGIGMTQYTNLTFIGSPGFLPKQQVPQQYQITDTLSFTKGAHFLRFGIDVHAPMRNLYKDQSGTNGGLTFNGSFSGQSYADGLLGYVFQGALSNVNFVDERFWMASGFAQDDWKVTPKLTLNLGLRYDFATPPYSAKNQLANFDPSGSGALISAKDGSLGDRTLVKIDTANFAPRVGFAYSLGDKTVIRGGYGIYYLLLNRAGSAGELVLNPPFQRSATLLSNGKNPAFLLKNGFPANLLDPNNINLAIQSIKGINHDAPTPDTQAWSFGFQRQLPGQIVLTTDYVGTKSSNLGIQTQLNTYLRGTKTLPYPNFGSITFTKSVATSHYNGLELTAQRRFTDGFSLIATYNYSRAIETTFAQELTTTVSSGDVPHHVSLSYVYELPFGHGKQALQHGVAAALLGGWRTSGIYNYSSGRPFTVSAGGNYSTAISVYGGATSLPNMIGTPKVVGNVKCWFYYSSNKSCQSLSPSTQDAYALPTLANPFGNGSVNTLRGPNTNVFDFSLMRDFSLYERSKLQFRWEVFNLANKTLFSQPNGTLTSSSVGTITSIAGDPRIMQFALRLSF
jgi:hypothetical protein